MKNFAIIAADKTLIANAANQRVTADTTVEVVQSLLSLKFMHKWWSDHVGKLVNCD